MDQNTEFQKRQRNIATEYRGYVGRRLMALNLTRSANPNSAVRNCIGHMQVNEYGATMAIVTDLVSGQLHAIIKRDVKGNISIVFKRDPRDFVTKSTLKFFDEKAAALIRKVAA